MDTTEPLDLEQLPVGAVFAESNRRGTGMVWEVVSDCLDGTEIRYQSTGGERVHNSRTLALYGSNFLVLDMGAEVLA